MTVAPRPNADSKMANGYAQITNDRYVAWRSHARGTLSRTPCLRCRTARLTGSNDGNKLETNAGALSRRLKCLIRRGTNPALDSNLSIPSWEWSMTWRGTSKPYHLTPKALNCQLSMLGTWSTSAPPGFNMRETSANTVRGFVTCSITWNKVMTSKDRSGKRA